ncbi:DUF2599 domain-containing protein [Nocardia sp. NBC_01503]|uniref:DUF2599 domain-containing protein n=1 Tax=Nocardia sp. NBC_01503 TaxID=2975997 RepID=UPI002E7B3672|nr:DUF2599 domain-containing protein [Nocardia sp. NBC_01503]WTL31113.1 DUF2599 domain-containing protein [Nocardia sp. NBC_01503]
MRQRWKLSGGLLALALSLSGCGAAEESSPVIVGSLSTLAAAPAAPATTATGLPIADPTLSQAPAVDNYADQPLIDRTEWTEAVDGRRLLVYPTDAGRRDNFPTAGERAWQEVLVDSPDADTPGMRDQFICHWEWARLVQPDKPSWNLEPWRSAVGYQETVNAMCNPGGPER